MNDNPLYTLGGVVFSAKNRPLDSLGINQEYSWAVMERIGNENTVQATGLTNKTITLQGCTFPMLGVESRTGAAGIAQITEIEALQAEGLPYPLVDGSGVSYGLWVINSVKEDRTNMLSGGAYLAGTYTINLTRYVIDNVGGDGFVSNGAFNMSSFREGIQSFVGSLSNFFGIK